MVKQIVSKRSSSGLATNFTFSPVVNVTELNENNLLRVFDNLRPGKVFNQQALALYRRPRRGNPLTESGHQGGDHHFEEKILQAVMVSPELWNSTLATASVPLVKTISLLNLVDDFLLSEDRFTRSLAKIAPQQTRVGERYEVIQAVGPSGQVDLGAPFVSDTLAVVSGPTPTATFPATGLLQFNLADAGAEVVLNYVTQPIYNVIAIQRVARQPVGAAVSAISDRVQAYVLHPTLAAALSISVPTV